jgi:hypothetical protein
MKIHETKQDTRQDSRTLDAATLAHLQSWSGKTETLNGWLTLQASAGLA